MTFKPRRWDDSLHKWKPANYRVTLSNPKEHNLFVGTNITGEGTTEAEARTQFEEAVKQNKLEGKVIIEKSFKQLFRIKI